MSRPKSNVKRIRTNFLLKPETLTAIDKKKTKILNSRGKVIESKFESPQHA